MVKIGGNGDPNHPAFNHKIVYDYKQFCSVFEQAGFEVELLEYCDENGNFHYKYWNEAMEKLDVPCDLTQEIPASNLVWFQSL